MLTGARTRRLLCIACATALAMPLAACDSKSKLLIATWDQSCRRDAGRPDGGFEFEFPWSTGFEYGFCEFIETGYCYTNGTASYELVEEPVRSGRFAAAFAVSGNAQSRCFKEGRLPKEAYYGAWYYVPAIFRVAGNWNLLHFQGGDSLGSQLSNLWDISLVSNPNDSGLRLNVADYVSSLPAPSVSLDIPIGKWFHIEMYLKRAADETGEVQVFQDGVSIVHAARVVTDNTEIGQWYVGNLTNKSESEDSTVYVDDVTISAKR